MAKHQINRRRFISTTSGLAGGAFFAPNILRSQGGASPNNKLRVACISVGGKGESDSAKAAGLESKDPADFNDIVAIVDVDQARLDKAKQKYTGAEAFTDYRKMFEAMGDKIDCVTVSTPDHTHFPAAMLAVTHKKHVMVQKPMCNYIAEVPPAAQGRQGRRRGHADGQPGPHHGRPAPRQGMDRPGRDRHAQGNPPLDQPPDLAAGTAEEADRPAARGPELGHLARRRAL